MNNNYMKQEIPLEERKKIMVDILQEFHNFCITNNFKYSIWYGTAIGAIRHKGFIPWDDDIDVVMPREDYDKFLLLWKDNDKLELFDDRRKDYKIPFAKLCDKNTECYSKFSLDKHGVFIDVFPLDKVRSDVCKSKQINNELRIIRSSNRRKQKPIVFPEYKSNTKLVWLRKFKVILSNGFVPIKRSFISYNKHRNKLNKLIESNFGNDHYVNFWDPISNTNIIIVDFFDKFDDIVFENKQFKISKQYHKNLLIRYKGDYMVLPPVNQRRTHSYYIYYYKDN